MTDAVIVSAVRTAVARGKRDGALAGVHPVDLSAVTVRSAVESARVDAATVDDVLWGCAMPEAAQGLNLARLAVLRAGLPVEVTAATVNRFCSSGLQTIASAAQAIMTGMADVVVAGGIEMMSQVPMSGYHTRLHPALTDVNIGMGFTAERVAERWGVSREDQDRYAYESQQKAADAWRAGRFDGQIVPVSVDATTRFERDEALRPDTTLDALAKLRPAFRRGGTVTAGNSSPYSDGAAAVVVMSDERAAAEGLRPLARFVTFATAGVAPDIMGVGPVRAVPKALARAGLTMKDVDLIELNEAFASQVVAVMRELAMDPTLVNVNGGAIALGHPLGASGAKLTVQLVHELGRRGGGMGLVTMCVGGGMGAAGVLEVFPS